ncbi:phage shock protein C (PspC) family protein [Thermasporomyces composti]|uniref:Phage shock protein C (PspC) family protein n=1 Tax=Thermasporomyces composti TaxID=696763 RepID=A0A3D9VJ93_THECX|nr:phage shock protein C (PspC) family protein [Thermasporomyces composti]
MTIEGADEGCPEKADPGRFDRTEHVGEKAQRHEEAPIFTDPSVGNRARTPSAASGARPRCVRRSEGKVLGGVAGGLADHLGLQPLHVRLGFVALTTLTGFGLFLYAALWIVLPQDTVLATAGQPAGVAAATRSRMRTDQPRRARGQDRGQLLSIVILGAGALMMFPRVVGISAQVFWPLIVGGLGLALVWRQADESQRARWTSSAPPRWKWLWPLFSTGGRIMVLRTVVGLALVVVALSWGLSFVGGVDEVNAALLSVIGAIIGVGLIIAPWVWRLLDDLSEERRERIRSQERADMAAHLHDSVLQTLALIQKQAHDPRAVVRLARAQERDLRQWLYGDQDDADTTLRSALRKAAAEVEDRHGVPVELVVVGDAPLDPALTAVLRAAGEAMVNAAKHSGAPKIDVYAEVEPDLVEVFVRDRGVGFDPDKVGEDRLGVRRSIIERMERHGGKAEIRSSPGNGTEVRIAVERRPGQP